MAFRNLLATPVLYSPKLSWTLAWVDSVSLLRTLSAYLVPLTTSYWNCPTDKIADFLKAEACRYGAVTQALR